MLVKNKHETEMKEVKAKLAEAEKALAEAKKGEEVEVEKEVKEKESVMCGCGRGVKRSAELKAQLEKKDAAMQEELKKKDAAMQEELAKRDTAMQEELAKRDAEVSDLRGAQQGLQTKYGELEQKYASCLSEGTKLKEECEELNLQKEQFVHEIDMLRSELSVMRQEYVELMEE